MSSFLTRIGDIFRPAAEPEAPVDEISPELPVREFFLAEYRPRRLLAGSPKTLKSYGITLAFFCEFLGREAKLSDLTDTVVCQFAEQRMKVVKRATVKRDLDQLLAIWRFAHTAGILRKGPLMRNISVPTPTPIALTREQVAAVWQAINESAPPVAVNMGPPRKEVPGKLWWSAIFLVCWDTGERFNPVFELTESNVDLDRCWIRFPAHDRKGSGADNLKAIHPETGQAIADLLDCYSHRRSDTRIFRWALNRGNVWSTLGRIMRRAGLPDSREFKFHALRKSSTSHLVAAGGDGRAHAGHASDVTTRSHYLDPRIVGGPGAPTLLFRPGSMEGDEA